MIKTKSDIFTALTTYLTLHFTIEESNYVFYFILNFNPDIHSRNLGIQRIFFFFDSFKDMELYFAQNYRF